VAKIGVLETKQQLPIENAEHVHCLAEPLPTNIRITNGNNKTYQLLLLILLIKYMYVLL